MLSLGGRFVAAYVTKRVYKGRTAFLLRVLSRIEGSVLLISTKYGSFFEEPVVASGNRLTRLSQGCARVVWCSSLTEI